jgi:hypothetical protein
MSIAIINRDALWETLAILGKKIPVAAIFQVIAT